MMKYATRTVVFSQSRDAIFQKFSGSSGPTMVTLDRVILDRGLRIRLRLILKLKCRWQKRCLRFDSHTEGEVFYIETYDMW